MHLQTASTCQYDRIFILQFLLCSSLQGKKKKKKKKKSKTSYKAKESLVLKSKLHVVHSFILDRTASFLNTCVWYLLLHSDDITVSLPIQWEIKGSWAVSFPAFSRSVITPHSSPAGGLPPYRSSELVETLFPSPAPQDPWSTDTIRTMLVFYWVFMDKNNIWSFI